MGILVGGVLGGVGACQPEDPTCILSLGVDIQSVVTDSYNDVVRGSPSGAGSWSYTCNQGGSADIVGTANTSTVTFDLTYTFRNCTHENAGDVITLNGVMNDITTNGGSVDSKIESTTSDALTIQGDVSICKADPIDATCDVSIYYSGSWLTTICGLSYP